MFEDLTNWILELFKKNSGGGGAVVNAYRIKKNGLMWTDDYQMNLARMHYI